MNDEKLNSFDTKILYDLANEPKEYWEAESHHDVHKEQTRSFEEHVLNFLEKYGR